MTTTTAKADGRRDTWLLLALIGVWLLVSAARGLMHGAPLVDGGLVGPDSHMRLLRVLDLAAGGGWFDGTIARSNWPFGETLHWTRPLDVLILLLGAPAMPVLGVATALHWAGMLISPLLLLATVLATVRVAAAFVPGAWRFAAGFLLLAQPAVITYAAPGRADHHALLFLLAVALLGATARARRAETGVRAARAVGALGGLALWASAELLLPLAVCLGVLALDWVRDGTAETARRNRAAAGALVLTVAAALVLERPPAGWLVEAHDRLSIVHLTLAGLLVGFWSLTAAIGRRVGAHWARRLAAGLTGAAATAAILALVHPSFYAGPLAAVDPRLYAIWLDHVTEMKPAWPASRDGVSLFVTFLGPTLVALPYLAWRLSVAENDDERRTWWLLAACYGALLPAALVHVRFTPYVEIVSAIVLADALRWLFARTEPMGAMLARVGMRGGGIIGVVLAPMALGPALAADASGAGSGGASGHCPVAAIARHLNDPARGLGATPRTILLTIDHAPELLYRTRHRVIGTPYHRNSRGILDAHAMLARADAPALRALYAAREVGHVLLCRSAGERRFFTAASEAGSVYGRLLAGDTPAWLVRERLPAALEPHVALYRVAPGEL